MGNVASATATNTSIISANTNVSTQESCNNNQVIESGPISVYIGELECGIVDIGNITVTSRAVCQQYTEIAILSKVLADQVADANSETAVAIASMAQANASNYIDVQNNIAAMIAASCTNSQKVNIAQRSFTAGRVSGEECRIFNGTFSQEAACLQTIKADITNSTDVSQTSTAKATAGIDMQQLIIFIIVLCVAGIIFTILAAVLKSMISTPPSLSPSSFTQPKGLFGSGGPSLSELVGKRNALRKALQQRQMASDSLASFVKDIQLPPRI